MTEEIKNSRSVRDESGKERAEAGNPSRDRGSRDTEVRPSAKKTRRSKLDGEDELYINPKEIPDGFTVEWKRYSTLGKVDQEWLVNLERDGWEPAQPKDFPSRMGKAYTGNTVTHKDLILMIRPKELTEEAVKEEKTNAVGQVRSKFEELGMAGNGEAPRVDSSGRKLTKVSVSYDKIPVE